MSLRTKLPRIFTNDQEVIDIVADLLPVCALYQPFDAIGNNFHGILRGVGRQKAGGLIGLFCWYVIGLPVAIGSAFGLGWKLYGLWSGVGLALVCVATLEGWIVHRTRWDSVVEHASARNC